MTVHSLTDRLWSVGIRDEKGTASFAITSHVDKDGYVCFWARKDGKENGILEKFFEPFYGELKHNGSRGDVRIAANGTILITGKGRSTIYLSLLKQYPDFNAVTLSNTEFEPSALPDYLKTRLYQGKVCISKDMSSKNL